MYKHTPLLIHEGQIMKEILLLSKYLLKVSTQYATNHFYTCYKIPQLNITRQLYQNSYTDIQHFLLLVQTYFYLLHAT